MKTISKKRWYFFPPLILAALAAFSFLTMILWNSLLPGIFHLPEISFWQAVGLLVLSRLLFSGNCWHRGGHHPWKNRIYEKWDRMTPQEREQFRQNWPHYAHMWDHYHGDKKSQETNENPTV